MVQNGWELGVEKASQLVNNFYHLPNIIIKIKLNLEHKKIEEWLVKGNLNYI